MQTDRRRGFVTKVRERSRSALRKIAHLARGDLASHHQYKESGMDERESVTQSIAMALTTPSARVEIHSTSRPDRSDKNGLATGRKNRRMAVFAFTGP